MIASIGELNLERKNRNEPPIQVSVGLHYGQVVLGDIGLTGSNSPSSAPP